MAGCRERTDAGEFERLQRTSMPYAVLVLDIDYFKRINDTHGHATGVEQTRGICRLLIVLPARLCEGNKSIGIV